MSQVDPRIDKIKKLLDKATAKGTTEAEADAFREKAYELMVKWEIDEAQLDAAKQERLRSEDIVRRVVHIATGKTYTMEYATAMALAAQGMGLRSFLTQVWENKKIGKKANNAQWFRAVVLVGFRSDVDRAELLIDSLTLQLTTALSAYGKTLPTWYSASNKWNARRSFIVGWGERVSDRLTSLRDIARQDMMSTEGTGTELVLVTKDEMVAKWIEDNMKLGTRGRARRYAYDGMTAGADAGNTADIGQQRFGATARGAIE